MIVICRSEMARNVCDLHTCAQTLRPLAPDTASIVLVIASEVVNAVTELSHMTKLLSSFSVTERDAGKWHQGNMGVWLVKGIVTRVDRRKKIVKVSGGGELSYDKLSICTSASASLTRLTR